MFDAYILFTFFAPPKGGLNEDTQTVSGFHGWVNAYDEEIDGNFAQTGAVGADCGVSTLVLTGVSTMVPIAKKTFQNQGVRK